MHSQGRVVLDESPCCVKHIIHTLLDNARGVASGGAKAAEEGPAPKVAPDEEAYLMYFSCALGLSNVFPTSLYPKKLSVIGGSAIAPPVRLPWWTTCIHRWCGCPGAGLRLLYRASRDGFSARSFRDRAGSTSQTITLIRVSSDGGGSDKVVGGYSNVSWTKRHKGPYGGYSDGLQFSNSAFVFMVDSSIVNSFEPVKWRLRSGVEYKKAVFCGTDGDRGPCFGSTDLRVNFDEGSGCTLQIGREMYDVTEGSPFLDLDGTTVVDIEVFAVCSDIPVIPDQPPKAVPSLSMRQMDAGYTRQFGASIAGLLVDERMAVAFAQAELKEAQERAAAAALALNIVYGPDVASGKEDKVVEMSVRGVSVTTLRSTLEVCPDSVFIAWFADRWSGGNGKDEDGRYKVDCDPTSFSKILDVMRMRKRAGWAERDDAIKKSGAGHTVRVQSWQVASKSSRRPSTCTSRTVRASSWTWWRC